MVDQPVSARELLERGAYTEAADAFLKVHEYASAARAFVCAKDFHRAAECYDFAQKPLDAARLFMLTKEWERAASLYAKAGDSTRAQLAREQHRKIQESLRADEERHRAPEKKAAPPPPPPEDPFPEGEIWQAMKAGDFIASARIYLKQGGSSGWALLDEARAPEVRQALGETLFQARDYAVAAEAFRKTGEDLRAAQCLSLAGLNGEAADLYMRCGQRILAAQHLEKAQAWEHAADVYRQDHLYLDAARCHERDDDPVRAAASYLKARRPDVALPILQAIPPKHRQFVQCRMLAGKIFFQKGERELALSFLAPLLDMEVRSEEDVEAFYQLAVLYENAGEKETARKLYLQLQTARFGYKDVSTRLQKLEAGAPAHEASKKHAPAAQPPKKAAHPPPALAAPHHAHAPSPAATPVLAAEADLSPLQDCSLLHSLDLEQLRLLWGAGRTVDLQPGEVFLSAGQPTEALCIVLSGGLTITPDPSDLDLAVGFLGTSDYVGLGCLVQGPPRANALVAQGPTRLLLLPGKNLEALVSGRPDLGMRLFRSVAEQLSQTLMAQQKR